MNRLFFSFLLLGLSLPALSAEPLTLQSANGGQLQGTVDTGSSPEVINLIRSDGRLYRDVPIASFSPESQKFIAEALEKQASERDDADVTPDSRLDISFQRQKSANNNDYGDVDDRIVQIQPHLTIESDERDKTFQEIIGEVIIIGKEAVSRDRWIILNRQKFKMAALEPDGKVTWEGNRFECRYDPDYGGYDYEGHLIIVRNKAGEIAMLKGSKSRWEEIVAPLLKA